MSKRRRTPNRVIEHPTSPKTTTKKDARDLETITKDKLLSAVLKYYEIILSMECPLRCNDDGKQRCEFHTGDKIRMIEMSQGLWKMLVHTQPYAAKIISDPEVPVKFL